MFKNVIVGVDGRPNGRDAITFAKRLADPGGKLTLVHVHSGEVAPLQTTPPELLSEERDASVKMLEAERSETGVTAELVSMSALSPGRGLHREAEASDADLIVVGSSSRGALGRAMLGDDTRAALNGSPCAIAIAARGFAENPKPIGSVGVAYDGSPEARAALELARTIAEPTHASLAAMEVVTIPSYAYTGLLAPGMGDTIEVLIKEAGERMSRLDGVEGRAVYGLPGEELAAFGDEVDVLVVGSRSYGPVKRLVLGSTSEYLERHARCSLVVLPRAAVAEDPQSLRAKETRIGAGA